MFLVLTKRLRIMRDFLMIFTSLLILQILVGKQSSSMINLCCKNLYRIRYKNNDTNSSNNYNTGGLVLMTSCYHLLIQNNSVRINVKYC